MSKRDVHVFEVGPRDGLQNEKRYISFQDKMFLVERLIQAGVKDLELGAFVRADKVPQMADTDKVLNAFHKIKKTGEDVTPWTLVPNVKGMSRAIESNVNAIAVFTGATETFVKKNIGMTIRESLDEFSKVIKIAKAKKIRVRGYISTVFGCPYEGKVAPKKALKVIEELAGMGVEQVSIGDTIGVAVPTQVDQIFKPLLKQFGVDRVAAHFHDTRGTALANTLRALELGVKTIDSSAGGLGGCPYAPGAYGNLATEDLVYMLEGMGVKTGIDLELLCKSSLHFHQKINRQISSRVLAIYQSQKKCFI